MTNLFQLQASIVVREQLAENRFPANYNGMSCYFTLMSTMLRPITSDMFYHHQFYVIIIIMFVY